MRKIAVTGFIAMMFFATAAHSGQAFVAGRWIYWSLDLESLLSGITGKDVNKGTFVGATVTITSSQVMCLNPQNQRLNPGKGPTGTAYGQSSGVKDTDLVKEDRKQGKIFEVTSTVELIAEADRLKEFVLDLALCKDAPGTSTWKPVYWRDRACEKKLTPEQLDLSPVPDCYDYDALAAFDGNTLKYITGPNAGTAVALAGETCGRDSLYCPNWTFAFLPLQFTYTAVLRNDEQQFDTLSGQCALPKQISLLTPPPGGFAASAPDGSPQVVYQCTFN